MRQQLNSAQFEALLAAGKPVAIDAGAITITLRQASAMNLRRRVTGTMGSPADAMEWVRRHHTERRAAAELPQGTQA